MTFFFGCNIQCVFVFCFFNYLATMPVAAIWQLHWSLFFSTSCRLILARWLIANSLNSLTSDQTANAVNYKTHWQHNNRVLHDLPRIKQTRLHSTISNGSMEIFHGNRQMMPSFSFINRTTSLFLDNSFFLLWLLINLFFFCLWEKATNFFLERVFVSSI